MTKSTQRADPQARVGATIAGRFFLQRHIGSGGMGDVYEAAWLGADRLVALKVIRASESGDEEALRRLELEVAASSRLSHPGCVQVLDHGRSSEGELFIAMELLLGRDLAQLMAEEGRLSTSRAARIADQLLEVLEMAHGLGILHRDVKPANIMVLASEDGVERVKVLDFGNAWLDARQADGRLTQEGLVRGTPAYMSPEQLRGEPLDARCDLYAVGLVLHEMLAGEPPFRAGTAVATASLQLAQAAPPLRALRPEVPAALEALVLAALSKERSARPPSASAMRQALIASTVELSESPRPRPVPPTELFPDSEPRRFPKARLVPLAVALAVAMAGVALVARTRPDGSRDPAEMRLAPPASTPGMREVFSEAPVVSNVDSSEKPTTARGGGTGVEGEGAGSRRVKSSTAGEAIGSGLAAASGGARGSSRPREQGRPVNPGATMPERPAIRMVRGELNSVPTPPTESGDGVLVLQATPWAEVSVDGHRLGETPRELRIAAGSYRVSAVHPELGSREETVTLRPGERVIWTATLPDEHGVR